jgi:hypothetical protein
MTLNDVRKVLLENEHRPMEIHTTDGRKIVVLSKEHWSRWGETLTLVNESLDHNVYVSVRNIASIRPVKRGGRRSSRRR